MMLSLLHSVDAGALDPDDALTYLQLHEPVSSWWPRSGSAPWWPWAALLPRWTAQDRLDTARLLAGPLARSRALLNAGVISPAHVRVVVEVSGRLPGAATVLRGDPSADGPLEQEDRRRLAKACAALQERVLPIAARGTVSMTKAAARRALFAKDAEGERRRRQQARCTRDVFVADELDGLSTLVARMSRESAHAVLAEVNALAHAAPAGAATAPAEAKLTAHVNVVVALGTRDRRSTMRPPGRTEAGPTGTTSAPACVRHHQLKTLGRRYRHGPEQLPPGSPTSAGF